MSHPPIVVASNVLINPYSEILLGKRTDCGLWEVSGGKVEVNENIVNAGRREHREETGMELLDESPEFMGYSLRTGNAHKTANQLFLCMFYIWREWYNSPELIEGKNTEWKWFHWADLPPLDQVTNGTAHLIEKLLPAYFDRLKARWELQHLVNYVIEQEGAFGMVFGGIDWQAGQDADCLAWPRGAGSVETLTDKQVADILEGLRSYFEEKDVSKVVIPKQGK